MRQDELAHIISEVENGNTDALTTYAEIKQLKDMYDMAQKQIEPIVMQEAELYSEKEFSKGQYKFTKRNGATRYSYKNITEWSDKNKELKKIEEKYKAAFIAQNKGILTASSQGEELELPIVTHSKDSLIIKKV